MERFHVDKHKKMRDNNMLQVFTKTAFKYKELLHPDLDILNICCNKIKPIPLDYCHFNELYSASDITRTSCYSWLKNYYSKRELLNVRTSASIIHFPDSPVWKFCKQEIPDYYWNFLVKSPFFNEKDHEVAFYEYFLFVLCCIGIHILPIKKWRKKLRRLRRVFLQRLGYLQNP